MELSLEQQLIDTLKSAIAAKDDLIDHLKREIQRLNSSQITLNPPSYPSQPLTPQQPLNPCPFVPGTPGSPQYPQYPQYPYNTFIVTSGTGVAPLTVGPEGARVAPLTIGSIQSQEGSTTKIDFTKLTIGDPPGSIGFGYTTNVNIPYQSSLKTDIDKYGDITLGQ